MVQDAWGRVNQFANPNVFSKISDQEKKKRGF
jgi:hypothetical protein